ncbi:TPA: hypothetical protein DEX28_02225 [Patescibacteria group bacterium]|nr:MAG: Zn-dependent hydrolase of the beta-lactamase fold-like protein [Parcubacteria group bacterium GW2011_GWB1_45_10]HCI05541.1 hypothetical protein [Patescibacteria group bacterium]
MTIYWHGLSCFKIETNDLTIGLNPFAKNEKLGIAKSPRFKAQALLISSPDELYNYSGSIDGSPMIIDHAGEFELSGCFIYGIQGQAKFFKAKDKQNTVFVIKSEDLWLAHLGAFSGSSVPEDALEKLQGVDVLFLPIGGGDVCDAAQAASLVAQIAPKIVVPMHYDFSGSKMKLDSLEKFIKEVNLKPENEEKLLLKSRSLDEEKTRLVILSS